MARKTIRQQLVALKRRFPFRTRYAFLYKNKSDLTANYSTIYVYALIYDDERGHSVFIWNPHRRGFDWKPREWNKWLNQRGIDILKGDVMEAINSKKGSKWQMQRLIGYHGADYEPKGHVAGERNRALYRNRDSDKRKGRNKTHAKR